MTEIDPTWTSLVSLANDRFGLTLGEADTAQFAKLHEAILAGNARMNLTRITELDAFQKLHVLDALSLSPFLATLPEDSQVADVGSGAGFPALPLAIAFPHLRIVAMEATGKKAEFIRETASALGLQNLTVLNARAEDLALQPAHREQYQLVTARAVAELRILAEICLPLVSEGGLWLAMKTERALETELPAAQKAIRKLGGDAVDPCPADEADLPGHILVSVEKAHGTPRDYPRLWAQIRKQPLA